MTVAVRASTLIDGTGADPVRGRFVVIEDGVIQSIAKDAPKGATILCMLPDTGERYLSTGLFADIGADMNEEELTISRSTPSGQLAPPKAA